MEKLQHFIHGEYRAGNASHYFDLISPVDGSVYACCPQGGKSDVAAAYQAAHCAFNEWSQTTPSDRQHALLRLANLIEKNSQRIVERQCLDTGQLKHFIEKEEVAASCDVLRFFAGAARHLEGRSSYEYLRGFTSTIRREPLGVVGQITPWNYPFMMAIWKIAPALAAGNTVVLKPSETTPLSSLLLAELAAEVFPRGALNVVLGPAETGALVVANPEAALVSLTGSVHAGIQVARAAAVNLTRVHLELGGKAPAIVFSDADLLKAVKGIINAGFFNAGQDCTAATRILVEKTIYPEFLNQLVSNTAQIHFGHPEDAQALYGAINSAEQLTKIQGFIARLPQYAKVEIGGNAGAGPGFYFEPTIISGLRQQDEMIQCEVFGPVMTIQTFDHDDEALALANGVEYGLAASLWTQSTHRVQRFCRELDFGTVWINNHIPLSAEMPHGGFKKSGYGKDLSSYSLEEYTRIKHIMFDNQ